MLLFPLGLVDIFRLSDTDGITLLFDGHDLVPPEGVMLVVRDGLILRLDPFYDLGRASERDKQCREKQYRNSFHNIFTLKSEETSQRPRPTTHMKTKKTGYEQKRIKMCDLDPFCLFLFSGRNYHLRTTPVLPSMPC